ncbi:MAG: hypothetical protein GY842_06380 [bacterium]|nr:hypothetical protein [bacterium]
MPVALQSRLVAPARSCRSATPFALQSKASTRTLSKTTKLSAPGVAMDGQVSMYPSMMLPEGGVVCSRMVMSIPLSRHSSTPFSQRTSTSTQCFPGAPWVSYVGLGKRFW